MGVEDRKEGIKFRDALEIECGRPGQTTGCSGEEESGVKNLA